MDLNPNLRITTDASQKVFTTRQAHIIERVRVITPKAFLKNAAEGFTTDIRLLGLFSLSLLDVNNAPPRQSYTTNNLPDDLLELVVYGTEKYIVTFMMQKYALIDISYSDGGLSINLDRVGKLKTVYDVLLADWERILGNYKKGVLLAQGGAGLATPRFQSNLSRFIGMLGNGAFGWNIP